MPILEELWFGKVSDDPAEQEAARSFAATVAELEGLRPFAPAAQKLLAAVQNKAFRVADVSTLIESDTSLAARVLRLVNSAAYGLASKCTSVPHAVALLGAQAIAQMAAAIVILEMLGGDAGPAAVVSTHSASVANTCRVLLQLHPLHDADALFTCGLLHDVGKLLILQVSPALRIGQDRDPYPKLLTESAGKHDACHELERELYGYDHAVLAGHVLRAWQIPEPIPHVVAWHHQPIRAYREGGKIGAMVAMIRLANRISYRAAAPNTPDDEEFGVLADDEACVALTISRKQLEESWHQLVTAARTSSTAVGD